MTDRMCVNCDALIPEDDYFMSEDGVDLCFDCYEELQREQDEEQRPEHSSVATPTTERSGRGEMPGNQQEVARWGLSRGR